MAEEHPAPPPQSPLMYQPPAGYGEQASPPLGPIWTFQPRTSTWAPWSLACAIGALGTGVLVIPGIIFGHMALREIRRQPGIQGRGMAIAGLAICYALLGAALVVALIYLAR